MDSPSNPLSLFGCPPPGNQQIAGGLFPVVVTGIKWPASRFSYKTLSPEVGNAWRQDLRPTPTTFTGVTLWGPQGARSGIPLIPHPHPRTGVESVDSRAGLGSNPATPATLDRLLTFSSTFLCPGFPICEERMYQSPSQRAGETWQEHLAPRAGTVSEEAGGSGRGHHLPRWIQLVSDRIRI